MMLNLIVDIFINPVQITVADSKGAITFLPGESRICFPGIVNEER
jgi:hypothetical protein